MRLFIAVNFDDQVKSRLLEVQDRIKAQSVKGNFSRPENLHLTLAFIGETASGLVHVISSVIRDAAVLPEAPFPQGLSLRFGRTGCFRHSGKELWWIAPPASEEAGQAVLAGIRRRLGEGLNAAGIAFDRRPFRAHVTLGREIMPVSSITLPRYDIFAPVNRLSLMNSERFNGALVYTELYAQDLPTRMSEINKNCKNDC
ncbi:MAG: RNA 2',3'-cyclic phosphodiesterase [Treponema sp.]|nr:RNA 2',3'-cyclic phosphodiesterase [Treponema sp.]